MLLAVDFANNLEDIVCIVSIHVHVIKEQHLQYCALFFLMDELEVDSCFSVLQFYFSEVSSEVISFKM